MAQQSSSQVTHRGSLVKRLFSSLSPSGYSCTSDANFALHNFQSLELAVWFTLHDLLSCDQGKKPNKSGFKTMFPRKYTQDNSRNDQNQGFQSANVEVDTGQMLWFVFKHKESKDVILRRTGLVCVDSVDCPFYKETRHAMFLCGMSSSSLWFHPSNAVCGFSLTPCPVL